MKRTIALLTVVLFMSVALGAFAQTGTPTQYFKKYDPKVTFTVNLSPAPGQSLTSANPWGEFNGKALWTEEVNGIIWKPKYDAPNDQQDAKIALGIASNDLPDYIRWVSKDLFLTMMKNGQVLPIGDLMDKYASPLVKYLMQEFNDAYQKKGLKSATLNGKVYGLPAVMDSISSTMAQFWLRGDILKTLSLAVPDNLADFEKVMRAYKARYPSGIGMVFTKDIDGLENVLSMYNASFDKWVKDASGTIVYSSIQPGVKQGLAKMAEWYTNGWIDPEFVAKDLNGAMETYSKKDAFVFASGAYWNPYYPFPDMVKANPKITFEPLGYMKGPDGKSHGQVLDDPMYGWTGISAKTKNPEAMIYEMNRDADSYYRNHADLRAKFNFFYPVTEPKAPVNADAVKNGANPIFDYPKEIQGPIDFLPNSEGGGHQGQVGFEPELRAGYEMAVFSRINDAFKAGKTVAQLSLSDRQHYQYRINSMVGETICMDAMIKQEVQRTGYFNAGLLKINEFLGSPTPTMNSKGAYLKKLMIQTFTDIIVGNVPISKFDEFVTQWKAQGGDQITAEVRDWAAKNK
jgi:putative aldouronate transport system substrate-binding protein